MGRDEEGRLHHPDCEYPLKTGDYMCTCAARTTLDREAEIAQLRADLARVTAENERLHDRASHGHGSRYFSDCDRCNPHRDTPGCPACDADLPALTAALAHAERAEAERDMLRAECAQISGELGLPPTIRPAEGELRRMKAERDRMRAVVAAARGAYRRRRIDGDGLFAALAALDAGKKSG